MAKTVYSNNLAVSALPYAASSSNEATNGTTVDLALYKNNFRSVMFVVNAHTITDGTHTVTVQESANNSDWAAVATARVQGTLPEIGADDDNTVHSFGVVPNQRYVRIVVTDADSSSGGAISAVAVIGAGSDNPANRS